MAATMFSSVANAQDKPAAPTAQDAVAGAAQALESAPEAPTPVVKPVWWTNSCAFNLGFNQTALVNWAAGGYNNLALAANIDAKANFAKNKMIWNNRLQLDYGFMWSADKMELIQKSNDRIYLESTWAYKVSDKSKWDYSAAFDIKTQFSNTYDNYVQDPETKKWSGTLKSGCLSPAYINLALGMQYAPAKWFSVNLAPITGSATICTIEDLRPQYGMPYDTETIVLEDGTTEEIKHFKSALLQFGAQLKANLKASLNDVLTYETQLVMFYDYMKKPTAGYTDDAGELVVYNPDFPVRVNWDNKLVWSISKLFKLGLSTWLIYDPNVTITNPDGSAAGDKVQFKEFLAINFNYTIANKK